MRRALVIVGKAPRAGHAKTRLVPPLSAAQAADLSGAFLLDTIATGLSLGWERVSLVHPATPDEAPLLATLVPHRVHLQPQHGAGLGDALRGAFEDHFVDGFDRVVLIDSDSPTVDAAILSEACDRLADHDVGLGPTVDGGYYLISLRARHDALFENIAWSTPSVFAQTCERAADLRVHVLPEWYDVDVPDDLGRLERHLTALDETVAPRTRQVLANFQALFRSDAEVFGARSAPRP